MGRRTQGVWGAAGMALTSQLLPPAGDFLYGPIRLTKQDNSRRSGRLAELKTFWNSPVQETTENMPDHYSGLVDKGQKRLPGTKS